MPPAIEGTIHLLHYSGNKMFVIVAFGSSVSPPFLLILQDACAAVKPFSVRGRSGGGDLWR
jgi:hypothetical protein